MHVHTHVEEEEMGTKKKCTNSVNCARRDVTGEEASSGFAIFN